MKPSLHAALGAVLGLLLGIFSCGPGPAAATSAWQRTSKVQIHLVALHDGGVGGRRIGCGDSLVPVEVDLPAPRPALRGALEALLAIDTPYDPRSGLYTALHSSPLQIRRLQHEGGNVRIDFAGWVELDEDCDGARVLEQLTRTVLQFPDVQRVELYVDGAPLEQALDGRGGGR